jgi:hypothetical protein
MENSNEMWSLIKTDKTLMMLLRVFALILIALTVIITVKAITEPVKIFGIELNSDKIKHDTIKQIIHDTIVSNSLPDAANKSKLKTNQEVKADVKSYNQKGGQTANQINNN